jgi:hypothetical protein
LTQRFLSQLAAAVVTTKMINTPAGRFARDAAAGGARRFSQRGRRCPGDTCLPCKTGRAGNQPNRDRVDDHRWPPHPAQHSPANHPAPGQELVLIIVASGAGLTTGVAVDPDVQRLPADHCRAHDNGDDHGDGDARSGPASARRRPSRRCCWLDDLSYYLRRAAPGPCRARRISSATPTIVRGRPCDER